MNGNVSVKMEGGGESSSLAALAGLQGPRPAGPRVSQEEWELS